MAGIINLSPKRLQISKANMMVVTAVSIATFILVFTIFAARTLLMQRSYQARVIAKQELAKKTVQDNLQARDGLVAQYKQFVGRPENIISGSSTGSGDRDGDNAKIVLDALPSKYDFPALTSSVEKLAKGSNATIVSLSGSDDEVNQQNDTTTGATTPIEMPFQLSVSGNFDSMQKMVEAFERSIRPMNITKLVLGGKDSSLTMTLDAKTYYQPDNGLRVTEEVVK